MHYGEAAPICTKSHRTDALPTFPPPFDLAGKNPPLFLRRQWRPTFALVEWRRADRGEEEGWV